MLGALLALGVLVQVLRPASTPPDTVVSDVATRLRSDTAGASAPGGKVPVAALSWHTGWPPPRSYSAEEGQHAHTAALVAGTTQLSLAVLVLSCGRASCAEARARARSTLYNVTSWAEAPGAHDGFSYCGGLDARGSVGVPHPAAAPRVIPWAELWRAVAPPRVLFLVGAEGMTPAELARVRVEQLLPGGGGGDVLLLPSGDTYDDLHEKVLHGLLALEEVVAPVLVGAGFSAVLKTDTDSLVRLPQLLWALAELLPTARDEAVGGRYTDLVWGRFMVAFRRHAMQHDFAGGMGYVLTRGLLQSITAQMRAAPMAHSRRSTGGVAAIRAEDLGMSLLLLSRPHTQVNDVARFHDAEGPGLNSAAMTPASLVVHGLKTREAWERHVAGLQESALRGVARCTDRLAL